MKHSLLAKTAALSFLFFLYLTTTCTAQSQSSTEELLKKLKNASSDTLKSRILRQLAYKCPETEKRKALKYAEDALAAALKSNDLKHIERSYYCLGLRYLDVSYYEKALEFFNRGLEAAKTVKDEMSVSENLAGKGDALMRLGKYAEAAEIYRQALKINEKLDNTKGIAANLNKIAGVYFYEKNYEKSLLYTKDALKIFQKIGNAEGIAGQLHNIATLYRSKNDYVNAEKYFLEALSIAERINFKGLIATCKGNLGLISFNHKKNYEEALRYFQESLALRQATEDGPGISKSYMSIASVYLEQKDIPKALEYYDKAVLIAKEAKSPEDLKHAYMYLSEAYTRAKRFDKALEYYKKFTDVKDSLVNKDIAAKTEELSLRYETEKKDNSIRLLAKENNLQKLRLREKNLLIYGLAALALAAAAVLLLLYHRRKLIADRKAAELEQKLLRMRMNPHFIFNALNAVRSFMDEHKTEEASRYLVDFAGLMRSTLESSFNDYVPLEEELESLRQYLRLQQLRFKDKLDFDIQVDPELEVEAMAVPPMLAQPFLENAVEHGVRGSEEKVRIRVRFGPGKEKNMLLFEVEDDRLHGESTSAEIPTQRKHVSRAVRITEERLKGFNKKKSRKIKLDILRPADPQSNRGTKVVFKIPFVYS